MFLEEISYAHQDCIYLKYSNIVKYYYNVKKYNLKYNLFL